MIGVEGLRFQYSSSGDMLFDGLDHMFASGEVSVVTGASGRGKSTLLYVLGLLLRPVDGRVFVGGVDRPPSRTRSDFAPTPYGPPSQGGSHARLELVSVESSPFP